MFESARLKLTAWYLLIIMLISIFFSVVIYQIATSEIERIINRIEFRQNFPNVSPPDGPGPGFVLKKLSLEDLENAKKNFVIRLAIINGVILLLAGGAGYFLAGRTLRPIKYMLDEQNQFISNASHELRTPIATMRAEMEASLLEKKLTSNQAREVITSNLEELNTLQELTNGLLQLAHIHTALPKKQFEKLLLKDIIDTAVNKINRLAKKKNISISITSGNHEILGNKRNLIELLVILLDNAIKYSPENSKISISTRTKKTFVQILVADAGYGISEEDQPHLFERFYRADKSRSQTEGFGLGLSIAKEIVDKHGGSIYLESNINKGTVFTISLPQNHS